MEHLHLDLLFIVQWCLGSDVEASVLCSPADSADQGSNVSTGGQHRDLQVYNEKKKSWYRT